MINDSLYFLRENRYKMDNVLVRQCDNVEYPKWTGLEVRSAECADFVPATRTLIAIQSFGHAAQRHWHCIFLFDFSDYFEGIVIVHKSIEFRFAIFYKIFLYLLLERLYKLVHLLLMINSIHAVWSGLVWSGLVWSGLVWSGLVWSGLI
jgi:hypothetical protein